MCQDLESKTTEEYPRARLGAIGGLTSNRHPIICGGSEEEHQLISSCSIFENGSWNSSTTIVRPREFAAASLSPYPNENHSLLVTGGLDGNIKFNTMAVLSDSGWQELPISLPVTVFGHCMVLLNLTTVMLIGGRQDDSLYSPDTFYFNTENEKWVAGPKLISSRYHHSCGMLRNSQSSQESVIVAAGNNGLWPLMASVEILDVGASEWRTGPSLPFGIREASMVEDPSGGVLLIGGYNGTYMNTIYQLSDENSEWNLMPQKLKVGRSWATAFLVPEEITNCK